MCNPYIRSDGQTRLQTSWLCFLDILGFREIIAENNESRINELHGLLHDVRQVLQGSGFELELQGHRLHAMTAFTDNIVLGIPIEDDGESESAMVYTRLAEFQLRLALAGFFVRGGVAVGGAYVDDFAVYGPALIEAYEAESVLARDPRIVLAESSRQLINSHLRYYNRNRFAPQAHHLLRDRDGQWFIDYLQHLILHDDPEDGVVDNHGLRLHRDVVSQKLNQFRSNPRIWSKYEWVALYHNDFWERYSNLFDDEYTVEIDSTRGEIGNILDEDTQ